MTSKMTGFGKQPLRRVEVHLYNFNDVAIPYHVDLLRKHKSNIVKFQENCEWNKMYHEQINATRSMKQLKAILSELDVLRNQVQESDLNKFDQVIASSRESALNAVKDFSAIKSDQPYLLTPNCVFSNNVNDDEGENCDNQELKFKELELNVAVSEKLKREKCLRSWENLEVEVHEIHDLFQEFSRVVDEQKEQVDVVEENIDNTRDNIEAGTKTLQRISKLKASMYPLAGALVGGCLGGPVGLVAGIKIGGLAALGCGVLGFTGGRILKKKQEQINNQEVEMMQVNNNVVPESHSLSNKINFS